MDARSATMLTLATNTPLVDGLAPDRGRIRKDFPYYGAPYTAEEQVGVRRSPVFSSRDE
jgi:hypothetical protein